MSSAGVNSGTVRGGMMDISVQNSSLGNVTCFRWQYGPTIRIGTGVTYFENEMCLNKPVDASHYPDDSGRVYIAAIVDNLQGTKLTDPNIRLYEDGVLKYTFRPDDPNWIAFDVWYEWSGGFYLKELKFALYDGNTRKESHACEIGDAPIVVCTEGEERSPVTCWDGSVIHKEICRNNAWIPSGEMCPTEPVDPCEGVVCEPDCYGVDKYQTVCEDGICIKGVLIKMDDPTCGYVPPDPCAGVTCDPKCYGKDKYETECVNGRCIQGVLIQKDHPDCVYVPPDPDPDAKDYLPYIGIAVVLLVAYLLWRRK